MAHRAVKTLLFLLSWVITAPAYGDIPFFDDFNDSALGPAWTVKKPDIGAYSVADGKLKITPLDGDLFGPRNNYNNLFLIANPLGRGDFQATIKVATFTPTNPCQLIIIAYDDDDNYVRMANVRVGWEIVNEIAQNPTIYYDSSNPSGLNPFYLRLVKVGKTYAQYHSIDGKTFLKANETVTYSNDAPQFIGLIAFGSNNPVIEIDSFTLEIGTKIPIISFLLSD